jgi:NTP pyrophosphatase (non-canonical NTP hydrolase)
VQDLLKRLRKFRDDRNWAQFHSPKNLAISVSVEAGELLELFQWQSTQSLVDNELKEAVRGEAADVFLYLLLLCDRLGIDLLDAAHRKVDRNEIRYPIASSFGIPKPEDRS